MKRPSPDFFWSHSSTSLRQKEIIASVSSWQNITILFYESGLDTSLGEIPVGGLDIRSESLPRIAQEVIVKVSFITFSEQLEW